MMHHEDMHEPPYRMAAMLGMVSSLLSSKRNILILLCGMQKAADGL